MRFLRQVHTILCFYLLLSCAGALNLSAQDFRGALRGIVQDASGGRVPAAKILIHGTNLRFSAKLPATRGANFESTICCLAPTA